MKIGWIGLGNMGVPMASNLVKAGYKVCVYNRSSSKGEELLQLGASRAVCIAELTQISDIVITMLSDDEAVKDVFLCNQGILDQTISGKILIDMSTVSPNTSRLLFEASQKAGTQFLDAPVSGSVQPAREGNLVIMVGGDEEAYQRVKEIFDVLGKASLYLGGSGAGSSAKLAINLLLGITVQGIAESVLFAQKLGIEPKDMMTIIQESAVGTPIAQMKTRSILTGEFPAAFALKHMAKDLRLANESAHLSPLAETAYVSYQNALEKGLGELDVMAIMKYL